MSAEERVKARTSIDKVRATARHRLEVPAHQRAQAMRRVPLADRSGNLNGARCAPGAGRPPCCHNLTGAAEEHRREICQPTHRLALCRRRPVHTVDIAAARSAVGHLADPDDSRTFAAGNHTRAQPWLDTRGAGAPWPLCGLFDTPVIRRRSRAQGRAVIALWSLPAPRAPRPTGRLGLGRLHRGLTALAGPRREAPPRSVGVPTPGDRAAEFQALVQNKANRKHRRGGHLDNLTRFTGEGSGVPVDDRPQGAWSASAKRLRRAGGGSASSRRVGHRAARLQGSRRTRRGWISSPAVKMAAIRKGGGGARTPDKALLAARAWPSAHRRSRAAPGQVVDVSRQSSE